MLAVLQTEEGTLAALLEQLKVIERLAREVSESIRDEREASGSFELLGIRISIGYRVA